MRRLLPFVAVVLLALAGCTAPPATVSALPSNSPSPSPSPSPTEPSPSPSPSPTVAALPADCVQPPAPDTRPPAQNTGPYGALRVTGTTAVALTFDDGPDPVNTPAILDVLAHCGVKATFCINGFKLAGNEEIVRRMVREGHTICNHSWHHDTPLGTFDYWTIHLDLQRTNDAIHAIVGPDVPITYFRAPGGAWTANYKTAYDGLGLKPLDWDVDPWDWNFPVNGTGAVMTQHIVSHIESHVRPGSIILSHDYQKPDTTAAYKILIPWLLARYTLIALPNTP